MFSELKKAVHSPEEKTSNSTIRIGSADKNQRTSKNHVTLNINKLNKLHISNSSFKKSNISSYFSTPLEKSLKSKKNLKSQPNTSVMKIKFNSCKPEDYRYLTEARQKDVELTITI
jgi:hypothetical protein